MLNIKNDIDRVTAVFVLILVCYTALTFLFMHRYWLKAYSWRHKEHSHTTKFLDYDISLHAIMVTGLDRRVPTSEMTKRL